MKRNLLTVLGTLVLSVISTSLNAQVIPFSMAEEESSKNTPEGWTAVNLPTGLPEFTEANTFYITTYGASTASADNTTAIQAALDAAASAGGMVVVVPAGTWLTGYLTMGSKTVLHLCEGATLKMLPHSAFPTDGNGYAKMDSPFITGKNGASDIVIEGESSTPTSVAQLIEEGYQCDYHWHEGTGVEEVYGLPFTVDSYYDLQGRKVVNGSWSSQRHTLSERMVNGQLKKGLYIVNGKKTIIK